MAIVAEGALAMSFGLEQILSELSRRSFCQSYRG
jgi:hypothetical protein